MSTSGLSSNLLKPSLLGNTCVGMFNYVIQSLFSQFGYFFFARSTVMCIFEKACLLLMPSSPFPLSFDTAKIIPLLLLRNKPISLAPISQANLIFWISMSRCDTIQWWSSGKQQTATENSWQGWHNVPGLSNDVGMQHNSMAIFCGVTQGWWKLIEVGMTLGISKRNKELQKCSVKW